MDFDVEALLREIDDVTPEDREAVRRLFGTSKKLQGSVLRQSEFDRRFNENKKQVAEKEAALAKRQEEFEAEFSTLSTWHEGEKTKLAQAQAAVETAKREAFEAQQALDRAASEAGFDPTKYRKGPVVDDPVKKPADRDPDTGKYVTRDDFGNTALALARNQAELLELADEHRELFGARLDGKGLVDATIAAARRNPGVTLRQVWEEANKVPEKREALRNAAVDQRVKDAEDAAYQRARSEAALTGGGQKFRGDQPASPVLQESAARQAANQQRPNHIEKAVQDYEERRAQRLQRGG